MPWRRLLLSLLCLGAACGAEPERLESTYVREPGAATRASALTGGPLQLFLNRCPGGCTIYPGRTDARLNRSPIPTSTVTLPESKVTREEWDELKRCLYRRFEPFDVVLVETEPTEGTYIEAVIAGRPGDLGLGPEVGGISPMDCGLIDRGLNFSFFGAVGRTPEGLCDVIAHETGHTIGLDHLYLCSDVMTYLPECGEKAFQRIDAECGERTPRTCACDTGELQNSYLGLLRQVGRRQAFVDQPPRIRLITPRTDDDVEPAFPVVVDASDLEGTVTRVEVRVDGQSLGALSGPPWAFAGPEDLPLGAHVVEARGYDDRGQVGISTSTVTVTVRHPPRDGGFFDAAGPRPQGDGGPSPMGTDAGVGAPLPRTVDDGSCGCRTTATRPAGTPWLLLLFLGLLRRRR